MDSAMKAEAKKLLDKLAWASKTHPAGSHKQAEFMRFALEVEWPRIRTVLQAVSTST